MKKERKSYKQYQLKCKERKAENTSNGIRKTCFKNNNVHERLVQIKKKRVIKKKKHDKRNCIQAGKGTIYIQIRKK